MGWGVRTRGVRLHLKREVGTDEKRNQNRLGRRFRDGSKGREKRGDSNKMS